MRTLERTSLLADDLWDRINQVFGQMGGVYIVSCLDELSDAIVPVSRLLGRDDSGVLYIGQADCFLNRVIDLKKSVHPDYVSTAHDFGVHYKSRPDIQQRFKSTRLVVSMYESDNPAEAERHKLQEYSAAFGELPPFNRRD